MSKIKNVLKNTSANTYLGIAALFVIGILAVYIPYNFYLASEYYETLTDNGISVGDIHMDSAYVTINQEKFLELAKAEGQAYHTQLNFYVHHDGIWYAYKIGYNP